MKEASIFIPYPEIGFRTGNALARNSAVQFPFRSSDSAALKDVDTHARYTPLTLHSVSHSIKVWLELGKVSNYRQCSILHCPIVLPDSVVFVRAIPGFQPLLMYPLMDHSRSLVKHTWGPQKWARPELLRELECQSRHCPSHCNVRVSTASTAAVNQLIPVLSNWYITIS